MEGTYVSIIHLFTSESRRAVNLNLSGINCCKPLKITKMKFPVIWIVGIGLTLLVTCHQGRTHADGNIKPMHPGQDQRLDLQAPLTKILHRVTRLQKTLNVEKLIESLIWIVMNCILGGGDEGDGMMLHKQQLELNMKNHMMQYRSGIEGVLKANFTEICNTELFIKLHTHLWIGDTHHSLYDIVKFYWKFGDKNVFLYLKLLLLMSECAPGLEELIPFDPEEWENRTPPSVSPQFVPTTRNINPSTSALKNPLLEFQKIKLNCSITELLQHLKDVIPGVIDLILLLDTVIHEVIQEPSIHFLIGKVQEPAKGESFRSFWTLVEIREYIHKLDDELRKFLINTTLDDLIQKILGVEICNINLLETLLVLFEGLFWNMHQAVDPHINPPEDFCK